MVDLKVLFESLEGRGQGWALGGEKYRGKWRNLSHFLKEYFLENNRLMLMINIF